MSVHDTLFVAVHDSVISERQVHDTVVGVPGNEISIIYLHDTVIKKGNVRLAVRGNVIDCSADSLTLVIDNLVREKQVLSRSIDSSKSVNKGVSTSTLSDVEREQNKGWFAAVKTGVVNVFAFFGLGCCVGLVVRGVYKRAV